MRKIDYIGLPLILVAGIVSFVPLITSARHVSQEKVFYIEGVVEETGPCNEYYCAVKVNGEYDLSNVPVIVGQTVYKNLDYFKGEIVIREYHWTTIIAKGAKPLK